MTRSRRQTVMMLTCVVCAAAAAVLYFKGESWLTEDAPPSDTDSGTAWYCYACRRGFDLAARDYEGRVHYGPHPDLNLTGGDAPPAMALVPCPTCGKLAVRAIRCPKDGEVFDAARAAANHGRCPKCNWDPHDFERSPE